MAKTIYILDGYNLIHRVPRWRNRLDRSLEEAREALLTYCRRWTATRGDAWLFYVVFDGNSQYGVPGGSAGSGIRVIYSNGNESADDRILRIIHENGDNFRYIVVSDDRYVYGNARQLEAEIMTAIDFAAVLPRHPGSDILSEDDSGDKLPAHEADAITRSLMREWNV